MNIFLAGATGVIGRRLVPLLRDAGYQVTGTTRSRERAVALEALGAKAVVVDVFDARALLAAMNAAHPDVVIHQLTDLPDVMDPAKQAAVTEANSKLRIEGTRNLMNAAQMVGARRVVAQSIAFVYAPGQGERMEADPLDPAPERAVTVRGVASLEEQVLKAPDIDGIVLRYGRLYGPGTWAVTAPIGGPLHVDAAAHAALLAVNRGVPGIYNLAEDDGAISSEKAKRDLGFDASFRIER
ncbi:MAG: NAD-dependent epimerase/dehydratase family protein [Pseudomonadota bacterium]